MALTPPSDYEAALAAATDQGVELVHDAIAWDWATADLAVLRGAELRRALMLAAHYREALVAVSHMGHLAGAAEVIRRALEEGEAF